MSRRAVGVAAAAAALGGVLWVATPRAGPDADAPPAPGISSDVEGEVAGLAMAPDFRLVDTWGDKVGISDLRGRIVVLHFWAEWCASCKVDLEYFQSVHERYDDADVVVLGLAYASGDRDAVRGFVEELGVTFPVVVCDEETRAAYQVAGLPTNYVVDREGRIRHVSRRLMNGSYWDEVLEGLIAEG